MAEIEKSSVKSTGRKPSMTDAAVQAATPEPARAQREEGMTSGTPSYFLSEGMRSDLEVYGETTDPRTGKRITR